MNSRKRFFWFTFSITGLILLSFLIYFNFIHQPQEAETFGPYFPYCSNPVDSQWIAKVNSIQWVAYSSPNPSTEPGFFQPSPETIRKDLFTLKRAGFTGLVTYSSIGVMGRDFPSIAQEVGFDGIIMGVWDPGNQSELTNAYDASRLGIVLGFTVGNEGLHRDSGDRYTVAELCETIMSLRRHRHPCNNL